MAQEKPKSNRDEKGHFTVGNRDWEIRSSHGRPRIFATPEDMLEAAHAYFKWCDEHPEYHVEQARQAGKPNVTSNCEVSFSGPLINIPIKRLYTLEGVCLYFGACSAYLRAFKADMKAKLAANKKDKIASDFLTVISNIEEIVSNQQLSGAASGFFNANIIARKLGLGDKIQTEHSGEVTTVSKMEIK